MIPSTSKGNKQFFAFARVFSGRVEPGQKIYVCGPNFAAGGRADVTEAKITGVYLMMAARQKAIGKSRIVLRYNCDIASECAEAGQIVGLLGLDKYVSKSCTLLSDINAHPLQVMKLSVSPIVRVVWLDVLLSCMSV
jgi:elongation factor 2